MLLVHLFPIEGVLLHFSFYNFEIIFLREHTTKFGNYNFKTLCTIMIIKSTSKEVVPNKQSCNHTKIIMKLIYFWKCDMLCGLYDKSCTIVGPVL